MIDRIKNVIKNQLFSLQKDILLDNIQFDVDMSEYGVNSITFIQLIVFIEGEFEIEFDDEYLDVNKLRTINDFAEYITNLIESTSDSIL